ncbi:hypothetical protein LZ31DRAFT_156235 [Colletotrichum somersetense]|nr:hypothetical protein LZ31DRAFT_156235 [Colletotrichum somersetense]
MPGTMNSGFHGQAGRPDRLSQPPARPPPLFYSLFGQSCFLLAFQPTPQDSRRRHAPPPVHIANCRDDPVRKRKEDRMKKLRLDIILVTLIYFPLVHFIPPLAEPGPVFQEAKTPERHNNASIPLPGPSHSLPKCSSFFGPLISLSLCLDIHWYRQAGEEEYVLPLLPLAGLWCLHIRAGHTRPANARQILKSFVFMLSFLFLSRGRPAASSPTLPSWVA